MSYTYPLLKEVSPPEPGSGDEPSRSASYVHVDCIGLPEAPHATLFEMFQASVETYGPQLALGHRPIYTGQPGDYEFLTYTETDAKAHAVASALHRAGVQKGQRVAVFGQNCCEWMIILQACSRMGYVLVPLYDTLGVNAVEYIMAHSEAVYIAASAARLPHIAVALPRVPQAILGITTWGSAASPADVKALSTAGVAVTPFDDHLAGGDAANVPADAPAPTDLSTIMYTSGTTGEAKGVMLTHASIVASVKSIVHYFNTHKIFLGPGERMLSYLPLAHIFDRVVEEAFLATGATIGYWRGSLPDLVADITALKPTQFHAVPRVLERIYDRIQERIKLSGFVKRTLFRWACNRKLARIRAGFPSHAASPYWDGILFSKVKQLLGGEVKWLISGGAPLAPHIEEFFRVILCAHVVQGYGLTESCGSFIADPDTIAHCGTVGPPMPFIEFTLKSVPDMNYDALGAKAQGELLLKGPTVFAGYYKKPDQTVRLPSLLYGIQAGTVPGGGLRVQEEVLESGGWFHTGDIAEIQPDGAIKIIDRKKNIFKLSQGEYVAVEKVEAEYTKCPAVDQIWVYGDSFKSCLVAVAVPNRSHLLEWAVGEGTEAAGGLEGVCVEAAAEAHVLQALQAQGRASNLRGFEIVKAVHLHPQEFRVEDGVVTPTFKLRRPQLLATFQAQVNAMYKQLGA